MQFEFPDLGITRSTTNSTWDRRCRGGPGGGLRAAAGAPVRA